MNDQDLQYFYRSYMANQELFDADERKLMDKYFTENRIYKIAFLLETKKNKTAIKFEVKHEGIF